MTVVDVDTHWEAEFGPGEHPLEPWRHQFPEGAERLAFAVAGDLLDALPEDRRPVGATLFPSFVERARQHGGPVSLHPRHASSAAERLAWMDEVGIDHCLVNPGGYWQLLAFVGAEHPQAVSRLNDWLGEQLADGADRLHGVAVVDFGDLGAAARELERARARGYRAFFLATVRGRPPAAVPPGHPAWDIVWSAATDLGMVVSIHTGNTSADFSGWADIGWDLPGGAGIGGLTRLANTQRIHAAQNLIVSMLYGGVFERHPTLTVMLQELKIGWLPSFLAMCSRQAASSPSLGEWPFSVSGAEMLHRNLRFTPLPGFGDVEVYDVLDEFPEMALFSSDYPHQEGNADPINLYGARLDALGPDRRDGFLGANALEMFARMGDPL